MSQDLESWYAAHIQSRIFWNFWPYLHRFADVYIAHKCFFLKLIYFSYNWVNHVLKSLVIIACKPNNCVKTLRLTNSQWPSFLKNTQLIWHAEYIPFIFHQLPKTSLNMNNCKIWYISIRQKTGIQNIVKEIKQYQKKWLQHVQRMDTNRLPKQPL